MLSTSRMAELKSTRVMCSTTHQKMRILSSCRYGRSNLFRFSMKMFSFSSCLAGDSRRLQWRRPTELLRVDRRRPLAVRTIAFREGSEIQDWRVKEMVAVAHKYFVDFLTKGDVGVVEEIFDESIVHTDVCWDPVHPTVGVPGMKHYLEDLKTTFPDFWVEIDEIAMQDTNSIWVRYEGVATGLGEYHGHKASGHTNNFTGVNMFTFNADRSKIIKVDVMRTAFSEDREELQEKVPEAGFRELRLKRLV